MVEDQRAEFVRNIAYKTSIGEINSGVFVKKQGWESSYIQTSFGDFARINIIAVIVGKEENSVLVDDGSGKISARFFENNSRLDDLQVGDVVLMIGRPREYNKQIYITLEIIKKIDRAGWIAYRKKELSLIKKIRDMKNVKIDTPEPTVVESQNTLSSKERMIKLISQLDTGSGASIDDVVTLSKIGNAEDIVQDLLLRGDVFEVKPGRLKLM